MKTTIKQLAALAIFSLIFLVGNVNAKGNKAIASSLETTVETSLQLESWMTEDAIWNTGSTRLVEQETEATMEMECWMTDESTWEIAPKHTVETDGKLELEQWMVNENNWKI